MENKTILDEPQSTNQPPPEFFVLDKIAQLMDNSIPIPFTQRKFGLDAVIGLVPTAGDMATFGISGLLVLTIIRHGVSFTVLCKMIWNIILDAAVGTIPILGDFFDFTFKANRRNMTLLKAHYAEGGSRMNAWLAGGILATVVVLVFLALLTFTGIIIGKFWTLLKGMM